MSDEEMKQEETEKEESSVPDIVYCPTCGLPPEYCEFGPSFEKCKPWLLENYPDLYPNLKEEEGGDEDNKDAKGTGKRGGKGLVKPEQSESEVKMLPGGKVKKKEKPFIHIQRVQRKWVTIIVGLDKFGVKLADASKLFAKKFSCGASVVKSPSGEDEIDVQGDFTDDIIDFIMEKWEVPEDSILTDDGKHKGTNKSIRAKAAAAASATKE